MNVEQIIGANAIGELAERLKKLPRSPKEMDRELARDLLPQLAESTIPKDQIRFSVAIERIWKYRSEMAEQMGMAEQFFKEKDKIVEKNLIEARKTIESLNIRLSDKERDLRAAQELRGTNESKRVAELEKQLKAQDIHLGEKETALNHAVKEVVEARNALAAAKAELEGRKAQAASFERDITQLTTAAQAAAEEHRQNMGRTTTKVRALLGDARDKIDDRWGGGKLTPYLELIRNDIVNALKALPPP